MERLTEKQVLDRIQTLDFKPLTIEYRQIEPYLISNLSSRYQPDVLADISWEGEDYKFIVEIKTISTPKAFEGAISQIKQYLQSISNSAQAKIYPLIVTPYLNKQQLDKLVNEKISGIDLSGNGVVNVPGRMFIYRYGESNKFPSSAPIKNIYRGTSSLATRVFFNQPNYKSVTDVFEEIQTRGGKLSIGTVSKVLKQLDEDLIISRSQGISLIDGKRLLELLSKNYRPVRIRTVTGKIDDLQATSRKFVQNAAQRRIRWAIESTEPWVLMPSSGDPTRIFTESIEKLTEGIEVKETNRFPNVELIETNDQTVYFDLRRMGKLEAPTISPIQIYLELSNGGKREQESAARLAEKLLGFSV